MLYVVVIVCVFKFLFCVSVVLMMQQLKSMGVLIHPNSDQLDILEKVVEIIIIDGANMKGNCYVQQYNIDTTLPQPDNTQRLSGMIEEISNVYEFKLKHEPKQAYILHKSCVMKFLRHVIGWT